MAENQSGLIDEGARHLTLDRRHLLRLVALSVALPALPAWAAPAVSFAAWLQSFRAEAHGAGISNGTLDAALAGLEPVQKVLDLDRHQPETTITFQQYIAHVVNPQRIAAGRQRLADNRTLLEEIGARYDVQPRFIVALWGIESDFGAVTGNFSVVAALATLAWSSTRPALFRAELLAALKILDQGRIAPGELKGSWAGAMGQTQFMPSSFLRYAVDYDGNGRQDIWTSHADVFASIANYLSHEGWDGAFGWGREVTLPAGFDHGLTGGKILKPVAAWVDLGVRSADGDDLAGAALPAGLVQPGGEGGPTLLTYGNYRVIMRWNHSTYFATAASYLADQVES
jgi:membrane-bound lytic murein transglycosylase B